MRFSALLPLLVLPLLPLHAQDSDGSDEVIALSPFEINSDDSGYSTSATLAGSRMNSNLIDPNSPVAATVPVSINRRADAVAVQFVLSHNGDKQEVRNRELYASVELIEKEIAKTPGLRAEQREVRFAGGNRKVFSSMRGGSPVSFASLIIFAELPPGVRVADQVKKIRDLLMGVKLPGQTKAADGSVGLYVKNPNQYRGEILAKIFEDFDILKKQFGGEFEIMPSGLNQKVRSRVSGEGEVELWIDYSFTFYSIRALSHPATK
jgi:hypothetical protein